MIPFECSNLLEQLTKLRETHLPVNYMIKDTAEQSHEEVHRARKGLKFRNFSPFGVGVHHSPGITNWKFFKPHSLRIFIGTSSCRYVDGLIINLPSSFPPLFRGMVLKVPNV